MNLNQTWLDITKEDKIGFYTYETRNKIPVSTGGVYAWLLPLRLNLNNTLRNNILKYKKIQAYDANNEAHSTISNTFGFNWDPIDVELKKNDEKFSIGKSYQKSWDSLDERSIELVKQSILLGSIFTQPLYIGYTDRLKQRYEEHSSGSGAGSNFHRRLSEYLSKLSHENSDIDASELNIEVKDLLFVCLIQKNKLLHKNQLKLIEEILQILAKPIFSKI